MDSFEDVLKARDRLVARLRERPRQTQAIPTGEHQALLASFAARLDAATRAKDQAIQHYDDEIRYYAELVTQLEAEVASDQSRTAEGETTDTYKDEAPNQPALEGREDPVERVSPERPPRKTADKASKRRDT
jgi:hypothetical protein